MSVGTRQFHFLFAVPDRSHIRLQAWPLPRGVRTEHILDELCVAYIPVGAVLNGVEELNESKNLTVGRSRRSASLLATTEYVTVDLLPQRHEVFALNWVAYSVAVNDL